MLILPFCNIYFFINGANVTERWMWRSAKHHVCLNREQSAAMCALADCACSWWYWKSWNKENSIWEVCSFHQSGAPCTIKASWIHMVCMLINSFVPSMLPFFTETRVACLFPAIYQLCLLLPGPVAFPYMKLCVSHPSFELVALPSSLTSFS